MNVKALTSEETFHRDTRNNSNSLQKTNSYPPNSRQCHVTAPASLLCNNIHQQHSAHKEKKGDKCKKKVGGIAYQTDSARPNFPFQFFNIEFLFLIVSVQNELHGVGLASVPVSHHAGHGCYPKYQTWNTEYANIMNCTCC